MTDAPRLLRPSVLLSAGIGGLLLLASFLAGWPAIMGWLGGLCIGYAIGAAFGAPADAGRPLAPAQLGQPQRSAVTAEGLTDLELRAKVRGDFETAGLVDRLQALFHRLRSAEAEPMIAGSGDPLAVEMLYKLRQMYDFSAASLERALALHVAAREMATEEGRRKVLDQRAAMVGEVQSAVTQIEAAVDRVRAAATTAGDAARHERLTDLNKDLDRQLEVARRVEASLNELEARARGDYSAAERYVTGT